MTQHFLLIHRPGPAVEPGTSAFDHPGFPSHVAYLQRLATEGRLLAAGPLTDVDGEGVAVVAAESAEAAAAYSHEHDGSVADGVLSLTVRPWLIRRFDAALWPSTSPYSDVLAALTVTDLDRARGWYEALFGRAPDREPMPGLLEWQVVPGGAVQVVQGDEGAGGGTCTLVTTDLDGRLAKLRARGVDVPEPTTGTGARFTALSDPDGNTVVLASAAPTD